MPRPIYLGSALKELVSQPDLVGYRGFLFQDIDECAAKILWSILTFPVGAENAQCVEASGLPGFCRAHLRSVEPFDQFEADFCALASTHKIWGS
jgi:hypothetical protein